MGKGEVCWTLHVTTAAETNACKALSSVAGRESECDLAKIYTFAGPSNDSLQRSFPPLLVAAGLFSLFMHSVTSGMRKTAHVQLTDKKNTTVACITL